MAKNPKVHSDAFSELHCHIRQHELSLNIITGKSPRNVSGADGTGNYLGMSLESSRIVEFSSCGQLNRARRKPREQNIYNRVINLWKRFFSEHSSTSQEVVLSWAIVDLPGTMRYLCCCHTVKRSRNVFRSRSHGRTMSIKARLSVVYQATNITKFQFNQDRAPV